MKQKHWMILFLILILDQITKIAVATNMNLHESIPIISGFFSLTYVQNTGAAWSMLQGNMIFFYLITMVAIVVMITFYRSQESTNLSRLGIVLMLGGTLGNFLDRIRLQYVVDFFDFIIFGYDFPIFNVADIFLCIGVGVLILSFLLEGDKREA